jgi:hypothetical protein
MLVCLFLAEVVINALLGHQFIVCACFSDASPVYRLWKALFLKPLDDAIQGSGLFYARFMDDWIGIAPTRWKLRKAVKQVNAILNRLLLKKHPDKTFIGKAERGFDFPGYFFRPGLLRVAKKNIWWSGVEATDNE